MGIHGDQVRRTGVKTADGAVKSGPGYVFWIVASAAATGGAWQLNDSTDDSGTDLISAVSPANSIQHIQLTPPLYCATGIYTDIPGTNVTLTVGYE